VIVRRPKRWPLELLAPYIVDLPSPKRERGDATFIEFASLFGNSHPVELEVGCGKGGFLVAAAADRPEQNFIGLEIDRALYFYIASRLAKRDLPNARVGCADAKSFVRDRIADEALAAVHVYFPDPWWKKRHHKRRLWTPEFAAQCVRVIRPGGYLHVATDVPEYASTIRDLLDGQPQLSREQSDEQHGEPSADEALTNFERKARVRGGEVWRAAYVKRA
jgi:tRNA (guanine-N7-)-methyltransferase